MIDEVVSVADILGTNTRQETMSSFFAGDSHNLRAQQIEQSNGKRSDSAGRPGYVAPKLGDGAPGNEPTIGHPHHAGARSADPCILTQSSKLVSVRRSVSEKRNKG